MRGKAINRTTAGMGILIAAAGALMLGATTPAGADDEPTRKKIDCSSRPGNDAKANYSWGKGIQTTRVYYNNHCSKRMTVTLTFISNPGTRRECWRTPRGKGDKLFTAGLTGIRKGCHDPGPT
jgi:hypothetical protein